MARAIRIALYGDVDLNLIDGSAVWLVSLAQTLLEHERVELTVLRKRREERAFVTAPLRQRERVRLVDPAPAGGARLTPARALDQLERMDDAERFDVVLLRGFSLCQEAARRERFAGRLWCYLTDIPQRVADVTPEQREGIASVAAASDRVLCQTEELRGFLEGLCAQTATKTVLVPPMIPPSFVRAPGPRPARPLRLLYAGKFAPMWAFLEMVEQFQRLRAEFGDVELHVAGDKIHNPPDDPEYAPRVRAALTETDGLVWHGAVSRERVAELLADTHVALSPRHRDLDDSLELSTKILEYGAAGVPVVCNRTPMHVDLYGADYPLFVDAPADVAGVVAPVLRDPTVWGNAQRTVHAVAQRFTFPQVAQRLRGWLDRAVPAVSGRRGPRPARVVVASHDRKFFRGIEAHLRRTGADVRVDEWQGHGRHDPARSRELLEWADVVVAEWCLGNAVWYSKRVRADQRMVVRFHLQEVDLEFPASVRIGGVERVVFVGDWIRDLATQRFRWPAERLTVVPNTVDTLAFDRPKLPGARRNLGLLGILPARKRLDRALDLVERLRARDGRYHLYVAGPLPWDVPWVWRRPDERTYYLEQFERVGRSPLLREGVSFDGPRRNIPSWMRKIGYMLSVSDFESFHLAPAEGMASRATPVFWHWDGVEALYPKDWIHEDLDAAATAILADDEAGWLEAGEAARTHITTHYDLDDVADRWARLVLDGS